MTITEQVESILNKAGLPVGTISGNYKKVADNPSKWEYMTQEQVFRNESGNDRRAYLANKAPLITDVQELPANNKNYLTVGKKKLADMQQEAQSRKVICKINNCRITAVNQTHIFKDKNSVDNQTMRVRALPFVFPIIEKFGVRGLKTVKGDSEFQEIVGKADLTMKNGSKKRCAIAVIVVHNKKTNQQYLTQLSVFVIDNKVIKSFDTDGLPTSRLVRDDRKLTSSKDSHFSACTSNIPLHYNDVNKSIEINITDITGKNKQKKIERVEKAFYNRDSLGRFTFGKLAPNTGVNGGGSVNQSIQTKRLNLANKAPLITGVKPLQLTKGNYINEIKKEYAIIKQHAKKGIPCNSLGIKITKINEEHEYKKNGKLRPFNDVIKHASYIPFIEQVLKTGLYDKTMDRVMSKKNTPSHEVIGRAEIIEKGIKKRIGISVIVAEDVNKQVCTKVSVFRLDDKNGIVKSLLITAPRKNCPKKDLHKDSTITKCTSNIPLHYNDVNKSIEINITDITEGNRAAKYMQLEKCLNGETPEYIPADGSKPLGTVNINMKDLSRERVEKALRTLAFSFDIPQKAAKGEIFFYKAQEDLTDKWCIFFSELVRNTYDYVTEYLDLPKKTVMLKSGILTHKGKILYNSSTGEPIKQADWNKFVGNLEKFLNRNVKDVEKKIILEAKSLSKILNRMLKYNSLEAVKNLRLNDIEYHGKSFDWISESVKNMQNVFGESLTRQEQARIEVMTQSAAQKITNINDKMCGDIKQILIDGVKNKQSKGQVSQALFDKMVGDNRDFQRVADTEIQNAFNNSFVQEEVCNTEEGKKTYFKRIEVIDSNTCPKCKAINGKIAVWSEKPLSDEKSKDKYADYVIWEGKDGSEWELPLSVKHPYCRGTWTHYDVGLDNIDIDALVAEQSENAKKWNNAVDTARKEYKDKGLENPDDSTKGFTDRIKELYNAK